MGKDEDRAFEILRINKEIHEKLIEKYGGNLIKELGDGLLVSFNSSVDAVRCAIEIQKECKEKEIPLKIGIHEGDMVFEGNDVLGDGVMDAILLHLSKIKDLRVVSRTSTEKYRDHTKTIPEIASELNVTYILEGSFQKFGDNARLIVQLINASEEGHVWGNDYERNWFDIFTVQSEVAHKITKELHAEITAEEKEIIDRSPTTSLTAYDYFLQAELELFEFTLAPGVKANSGRNVLSLYNQVLNYDSTFAKAYVGLAVLYYFWNNTFARVKMDSILTLVNIALSYDDKCPDAYDMKGHYYMLIGDKERGFEEFDKAIIIDPNFAMAYKSKGAYNLTSNGDIIVSFENLHKAAELEFGPSGRVQILDYLAMAYESIGFFDRSDKYNLERLNLLKQDSTYYYHYYSNKEEKRGIIDKAIFWEKKALNRSPSSLIFTLRLGYLHSFNKQYDRSYSYYQEFEKPLRNWTTPVIKNSWIWIGLARLKMGDQKEADFWLNKALDYNINSIESGGGRSISFIAHYDLARIYALQGNYEKAYQYLELYNSKTFFPYSEVVQIKSDPFFDNLRDEERFQAIVRSLEEKYQRERERVRIWLTENNLME